MIRAISMALSWITCLNSSGQPLNKDVQACAKRQVPENLYGSEPQYPTVSMGKETVNYFKEKVNYFNNSQPVSWEVFV